MGHPALTNGHDGNGGRTMGYLVWWEDAKGERCERWFYSRFDASEALAPLGVEDGLLTLDPVRAWAPADGPYTAVVVMLVPMSWVRMAGVIDHLDGLAIEEAPGTDFARGQCSGFQVAADRMRSEFNQIRSY